MTEASAQTPPAYDPADPAVIRDPYPALLRLQREDPAHWSPTLRAWILTRHADVRRALNDPAMSVDRIRPFYQRLPEGDRATLSDIVRYLDLWLVFRDPPEHTRLRRLMAKAFTRKTVEGLRAPVEALVAELLDDLPVGEEIDFVDRFAMALPGLVIMDLLGVPREELGRIKSWSDEMQLFIGSARSAPDKNARAAHGAREMASFFRELIEARRRTPQDDLTSQFVAARDGGDALGEDELVAACMLVLFGGHETTTNLLTTGFEKFIRHPDQAARLRHDPSLAASATEECLRLDGPSGSMARLVAEAHDIAGKTLEPGQRVFAMLNAANMDPEVFDDPLSFDIGRDAKRHVTFGYGTHFCIGAALARLEGEIAFPALVERFPNARLAGEGEWHDTMIMRGLRRMPVVLG
ncbi:MAG: cytochrome P450 [Pseudomonadota bacterium]